MLFPHVFRYLLPISRVGWSRGGHQSQGSEPIGSTGFLSFSLQGIGILKYSAYEVSFQWALKNDDTDKPSHIQHTEPVK